MLDVTLEHFIPEHYTLNRITRNRTSAGSKAGSKVNKEHISSDC